MVVHQFKDTESWLAARQHMLGASESPAVLGANPWRTAFGVYAAKVDGATEAETSKMRAGQFFEDAIARYWAHEGGHEILTPAEVAGFPAGSRAVWQIDGSPLSCTPDFFVRTAIDEAVVEVKRVDPNQSIKWKDGPPLYYVMQVQHQIGVLRECGLGHIEHGYLVADFGGDDVREYEVVFDADLWALLKAACEKFWVEHVLAKTPPAVDLLTPPEEVARVWRRAVVGSAVEVPAALVVAYRDAKEEAKIAEEAADQAKAKLLEAIKDAEGATVNGALVATWKNQVAHIEAKPARDVTSRPLRLTKAAQAVTP